MLQNISRYKGQDVAKLKDTIYHTCDKAFSLMMNNKTNLKRKMQFCFRE